MATAAQQQQQQEEGKRWVESFGRLPDWSKVGDSEGVRSTASCVVVVRGMCACGFHDKAAAVTDMAETVIDTVHHTAAVC